jgi:predicted SAM-dependent methyltransferase
MNPYLQYDRLNIGCGYDHRPGFLNVDMDPACKPDLLIRDNDLTVLPKRHFSEVLARDILEHIPRSQTMAILLEWADLLKIAGKITIQTSSILGVARLIEAHSSFEDHHNYTIYLFGNQAHAGDFHYTGFTEQTLRTYLLSAGFAIDSFVEWDNWLFLVEGTRVSDWTSLLESHREATDEVFLLAAYDAALGREPLEPYRSIHLQDLASGQSRRALLRSLFSALERSYHVAHRAGL